MIACTLIPTPMNAATPVSSCGTAISTPGDYVLANDLSCPSGDAIEITSGNVTLRLAGHSIGGVFPFSGISVNPQGALMGLQEVEIVGPGRIEGFQIGVHFSGVQASLVTGLTFHNDYDGIQVDTDNAGNPSANNVFAANVAIDVGIAFYDVGGQSNEYSGNSATETATTITGGYGMAILSSQNRMVGNEVNHMYLGILVQNANSNEIRGNRLTGNLSGGIVVDGTSSGNLVHLNLALNNGTDLEGDCALNRLELNAFATASVACIQ
jgi:parallel beta-helix repeat protein